MRRSLAFVDQLVVAVATNSTKEPLFSVEERVRLLKAVTASEPRIAVHTFTGLLIDFASSVGARLIIRGLRAVSDFEYEFQMALMNRHLSGGMETVFMIPSLATTYISSSIVREVARYGGDLTDLVSADVAQALRAKFIVGNRQELKQKVLDELEKGERKFLIDFARTGYIDSSGLGVLVSLSKKIREQGGELRLANLNDDLKTLFELTKLDTLFQIADSRERALESF